MNEGRGKLELAEMARSKARQATDERLRSLYEQMAADWEVQARAEGEAPRTGAPCASAFALWGEQIRAARALARLEQTELAEAAGVSLRTIKRLEGIVGPVDANTATIRAIADALLAHGIVFGLADGAGPGVRFVSTEPRTRTTPPR